MANDAENDPTAAAAGTSTLLDVLAHVANEGFGGQLIVQDDATFRCAGCHTSTPVGDFDAVGFRRLEGASDPDDMMIVVWGTCRECGGGAVATIGYGPHATEADEAALTALDLSHLEHAGSLGDESDLG